MHFFSSSPRGDPPDVLVPSAASFRLSGADSLTNASLARRLETSMFANEPLLHRWSPWLTPPRFLHDLSQTISRQFTDDATLCAFFIRAGHIIESSPKGAEGRGHLGEQEEEEGLCETLKSQQISAERRLS
mmetsp:Transcript_4717/g.10567  ORF Transcript_4717/g.10567 Transcript_4717/m.10567 type:complete len:131 (-) Transcript_4717:59-451(-)